MGCAASRDLHVSSKRHAVAPWAAPNMTKHPRQASKDLPTGSQGLKIGLQGLKMESQGLKMRSQGINMRSQGLENDSAMVHGARSRVHGPGSRVQGQRAPRRVCNKYPCVSFLGTSNACPECQCRCHRDVHSRGSATISPGSVHEQLLGRPRITSHSSLQTEC